MLFEKHRKETDVAVAVAPTQYSDSGDTPPPYKGDVPHVQHDIEDGVFGHVDDSSGPNYRAVSNETAMMDESIWLTRPRSANGAR